MKKRADLQGLRGMAISSVLLYHYFPETFKNGYIGVDQFFILSGFLMAEILSRDSCLSISGLFSFYYRRMKRILPLYALFILSTLLFSIIMFPFSTFTYNIPHSIRSLAFISNTKQEDETQTYERMLAEAENLFTHTWSLSCEVQFYAIAPFLILPPIYVPRKVFIIGSGILSYFLFTLRISNPDWQYFAFNSMITRIWQFSLGITCSYFIPKQISDEDQLLLVPSKPTDKYPYNSFLSQLVCISSLILSWFPVEIDHHFLRLLVCFQTAGLIYSGVSIPNVLLSNRFAVYFGDISYSLYLIHWPIYVYCKHNNMTSVFELLIAISVCIILAAVITETYETLYLKQEKHSIFILVASLYLMCFSLIFIVAPPGTYVREELTLRFSEDVNSTKVFNFPKNLTTEQVIQLNAMSSRFDLTRFNLKECEYSNFKQSEAPWTTCQFKNNSFSGTKRIMFLGNSYAPNIARLFIKIKNCQQKANNIFMYSRIACEVLVNSKWSNCLNRTEIYRQAVERVRPDILFIATRHFRTMEASSGKNDLILEEGKQKLVLLEKLVSSKIYILDAIPRSIDKLTSTIQMGLEVGVMPKQSSLIDLSYNYTIARNRMQSLKKTCTKCEIIDLMPSFTKNGVFQWFDENTGLQYFTEQFHLSDYGLSKVEDVYDQICRSL